MFKHGSTFFRLVIHTIGVLFLIGILGSTALGDEGIISTVVQTLYEMTFGQTQESSTGTTSPLGDSSSDPGRNISEPPPPPPPPDSLQ
jgi:hypothetical protein